MARKPFVRAACREIRRSIGLQLGEILSAARRRTHTRIRIQILHTAVAAARARVMGRKSRCEPWPGTTRSAVAHRRVTANISTSLSHSSQFCAARGRCTHFDSFYMEDASALALGTFSPIKLRWLDWRNRCNSRRNSQHKYICNWCKQW